MWHISVIFPPYNLKLQGIVQLVWMYPGVQFQIIRLKDVGDIAPCVRHVWQYAGIMANLTMWMAVYHDQNKPV